MLTLSSNLQLPLDAGSRRLAILAMSGAGKSNAAVVLAEAMFDAGIPSARRGAFDLTSEDLY